MGMYNEVFSSCPECGGGGYMQIGQIVLGFGEFHIDDPDGLADRLTEEQLVDLHERVLEGNFVCQSCGHAFNRLRNAEMKARKELANRLFGAARKRGNW